MSLPAENSRLQLGTLSSLICFTKDCFPLGFGLVWCYSFVCFSIFIGKNVYINIYTHNTF